MQPLFEFSSWGEGVLLDRWVFVHFVWGAMLAALLRMIGLSKKTSYLIALVLMLGWEAAEWILGTTSQLANGLFDVLLASAGFWLAYKIWPQKHFFSDALVTVVILGATVGVEFFAGKI